MEPNTRIWVTPRCWASAINSLRWDSMIGCIA
jgi:hypothetical protein